MGRGRILRPDHLHLQESTAIGHARLNPIRDSAPELFCLVSEPANRQEHHCATKQYSDWPKTGLPCLLVRPFQLCIREEGLPDPILSPVAAIAGADVADYRDDDNQNAWRPVLEATM
jgi:hypothetical protein